MFMAGLKLLGNAPVVTAYSAIRAVLGLGLMLRDCKRVIEYEEDEALPGTPSYLANSFLDLECMTKVDAARADLKCTIVGLIENATRSTLYGDEEDEDREEEKDGEDKEKDGEDEDEEKDGKDEEDGEEGDKKEGASDKVGDQESSHGDERQDAEGDGDIQMQEVQKYDRRKAEGEQKGKKRTRAQSSPRQAKKARIEDEPTRRSTRTRQPSKKVMQR
jgi:hypothetical protein